MPNYRRANIAGGTYFFTVNLADRTQRLLTEHAGVLREAFADTKTALPFTIEAIVVLPDHLHCIWALPPGDWDFSTRWLRIKAGFSYALSSPGKAAGAAASRRIWQRGFWEHVIRDDADYAAHVSYIHYNPVKHGHVKRVADWPYSSFHRFVRNGLCSIDWAGQEEPGRFGERV